VLDVFNGNGTVSRKWRGERGKYTGKIHDLVS
jgi:hypothetical protein